MSKKLLLPAFLLIGGALGAQCNELFFSEYLEGASNNKAIEIYNPSGATVNLTDYVIYRYNNGSPTPSDSLFPQDMLTSGDVWVAGNPSAVAGILSVSDTLHTITFFNGDDAMVLKNRTTNTVLDIIGIIGVDPGTNWPVGSGATSEFTLVRNAAIQQGNTNWATAASEYDVHPQNTLTFLGNHTMNPCCVIPSIQVLTQLDPACNGDSTGTIQINATGDGPITFSWINRVETTPFLTNVPAGTYSVVASGPCGNDTSIITLGEPALLTQTFLSDAMAFCDTNNGMLSVTASGGVGPYTYLWSNGDTTSMNMNLAPGIYTLTITDDNGCSTVGTYTITNTPSPTAGISAFTDPSSCSVNDGSVTVSAAGGTPGYDYAWSNGDTTATSANLGAGNYTVIVTDSAGCSDTASATLTGPNAPVVTLTLAMDTLCAGPLGAPLALNGEAPAGGVWSGNGVTGSTFYPDSVSLGWHVITYTYTDSLNCAGSAIDSVFVDFCSGISSGANNGFTISPNPFTDVVTLQFANSIDNVVSVYNMQGQLVYRENITGSSARISLAHLPVGIYTLQVNNAGGATTSKIQKAE